MKSELNVNVTGDTLTILEGKALEQKYPEKIKISGNVHSVANFLKARYATDKAGKKLQAVDKELAVVTVDEEKMTILLQLDPENVFGTEVLGKLETTPEVDQFCINTTKTFSREELVKLFRFNKRFFESDHEKILGAYQKLQIKTASDLQAENDQRGNKGLNFQKTVDSQNVPLDFILNIPIFKGFDPVKFRVEICLDATDASVRFWFESVEMNDIIEAQKKEIFEKQLVRCQDFVIIHK